MSLNTSARKQSLPGSQMFTHVGMGSLKVSKLQNPSLVPDSDLTLPRLLQDPLEKEIVTHSTTLAWEIPWMEEAGRL